MPLPTKDELVANGLALLAEAFSTMDCKSDACSFSADKRGMRHTGGCRCLSWFDEPGGLHPDEKKRRIYLRMGLRELARATRINAGPRAPEEG